MQEVEWLWSTAPREDTILKHEPARLTRGNREDYRGTRGLCAALARCGKGDRRHTGAPLALVGDTTRHGNGGWHSVCKEDHCLARNSRADLTQNDRIQSCNCAFGWMHLREVACDIPHIPISGANLRWIDSDVHLWQCAIH